MSLFEELKRRNVIKVAIAYVVVAWLVMQFSDVILNNIEAPGWVFRVIMLILGIGFALSLFFAWAFEMTTEGIKREAEVDRSQSITGDTGRKLDRIIIGFLVLALVYFVYERQTTAPPPAIPITTETIAEGLIPETPAEPSIAVLPFVNMSSDPEQEYFSDGISEELLNLLVRVKGLKVASRTSSFSYKGTSLNLADIASELQVDHVLEGSVRKVENRVRITAQLIDAATDRHLWSDTYDRELVDIFAIQDEIANAIVAALRDELGMLQDTTPISVKADTENLDAYELYLKGRSLFVARDQLEESIRLLETAVVLDPEFARAWESLGAVYAVAEDWAIVDRDYDSLSLEVSRKALELNPDLSMPWAVLGQSDEISWAQNFEHMDQALANDPKNATAFLWRSISWSTLGFNQKAIDDTQSCLGIDPYYENCRRHQAMYQLIAGNQELALELYAISAERGFWGSEEVFLYLLMSRGNRLAAGLSLWNWNDDRSFPVGAILDAVEFPQLDRSKGLEKLLNWLKIKDYSTKDWTDILGQFGAYEYIAPGSYLNQWQWLPQHKEYRQSQLFKQLYRDIGVVDYWNEFGFPPHCRSLGEEDFECD